MKEITTFEEDLLGLKEFAHRFERFIEVEQRFVNESLVISLGAPFGTGKTTFLRMWANDIRERDGEEKPVVVEVNAWQDDFCGDPLVSIISALIDAFESQDEEAKPLIDAAKDIGWFAVGLGNGFVNHLTGVDAVAAGKIAEEKKEARAQNDGTIPNKFFAAFQLRKEALAKLKSAIEQVLDESKRSIYIFVDELDRCRPDYAISYLETIKHIFAIKGLVFILGVNRTQLECSAKAAFGTDLDFPEYYRRFVHREVSLPRPTERQYKSLVKNHIDALVVTEKDRFRAINAEIRDRVTSELILGLRPTPRQIQEALRISSHVLSASEDSKDRLIYGIAGGVILISALKITHPKIFQIIRTKTLRLEEALDLLSNLENRRKKKWIEWLFAADAINQELIDHPETIDILNKQGFKYIKKEDLKREIELLDLNFGIMEDGESRLDQIFQKIEEIDTWFTPRSQ